MGCLARRHRERRSSGRAGNDFLDGGSGSDDLDGGLDNDWLVTEKLDSNAAGGRRVYIYGTEARVENGTQLVTLPTESLTAEDQPGVPFKALVETGTLSSELLAGITIPVFVGR